MWIYRLLFVCLFVCLSVCRLTVTDVSADDKASGVKFSTAVHRRELSSPRSPKSDESASASGTLTAM